MDYETLQKCLAAGRWQEADRLTRTAILMLVDRQDSWLQEKDLLLLPPADILLIDRLWRNYSNNRFGFSVQAQIWNESQEEYRRAKIAKIIEDQGEERGRSHLKSYGWGTWKDSNWYNNFSKQMGWKCKKYEGRWTTDNKYEFKRDENLAYNLNAPLGNLPSTYALGGGKSTHEYDPPDTESTMGFYGGGGWYYEWSRDSFVGYDFLEQFYPLVERWRDRAIALHSSPPL